VGHARRSLVLDDRDDGVEDRRSRAPRLGSSDRCLIVGSLPDDKQGVASAKNDTTREVGSAIGIAVMGSVYGSQYRNALPDAPAALPAEAIEAIPHSAAGGLQVAQQAGSLGEPIAAAVRVAFVDGLTASLTVVAVILAIAGIVVAVRAPKRPPASVDRLVPTARVSSNSQAGAGTTRGTEPA